MLGDRLHESQRLELGGDVAEDLADGVQLSDTGVLGQETLLLLKVDPMAGCEVGNPLLDSLASGLSANAVFTARCLRN